MLISRKEFLMRQIFRNAGDNAWQRWLDRVRVDWWGGWSR